MEYKIGTIANLMRLGNGKYVSTTPTETAINSGTQVCCVERHKASDELETDADGFYIKTDRLPLHSHIMTLFDTEIKWYKESNSQWYRYTAANKWEALQLWRLIVDPKIYVTNAIDSKLSMENLVGIHVFIDKINGDNGFKILSYERDKVSCNCITDINESVVEYSMSSIMQLEPRLQWSLDCKPRESEYSQVCMWPNCDISHNNEPIDQSDINEFEALMADKFSGTRIKYLETIVTKPGDGGPGGRHDAIFAVHTDDVGKFAVPRLMVGIRWIEDVIDNAKRNDSFYIYPERIQHYRTW